MDPLLQSQIQRFGRRGTWGRSFVAGSMSAFSYRTEVSITGQGYLLFVAISPTSVGVGTAVRVTIDGGTPYVLSSSRITARNLSSSYMGSVYVLDAQFKSSLLVETYNPNSSSYQLDTEVDYILST